jgi:predicted methyltransferase
MMWRCLRLLLTWLLVPFAVQAQSVAAESSREKWQHTEELFAAAKVAEGRHIADVGAGDGFLSLRLSPLVGAAGHIYAVDISDTKLENLARRAGDAHLSNIETIKGDSDDPRLPVGQLDAVFILNSYHEMPEYEKILAHIRDALKPGGRLLIAEPGPLPAEHTRAEQIARHHISGDFVRDEMTQAGFTILEKRDQFAQIPGANWYSLVIGERPK